MAITSSNAVTAKFAIEGHDKPLYVLSFTGQEAISRLFQFNITLASSSAELDLGMLVGKAALLTIERDEKLSRYVHGMVLRLQQQDTGRKFTVYQATLAPAATRLRYRRDCRIFQEQSARKIITGLLDGAKVKYKFRCKGNREPTERIYCVQYRETDWDFICRLLEEEGYYYYFEHLQDRHVLHMANAPAFHPDIAGKAEVPFEEPKTTSAALEHIFRLHYSAAVGSGKVTLADYNFQKPDVEMEVERAAKLRQDLELYDYPGLYQQPADGKGLASVRLEEAQAQLEQAEGHSDCGRFFPGALFKLTGHPRKALNGKKYLLTRLLHTARKGALDLDSGSLDPRCTYSNRFHATPHKVPYRPPRVTRKPEVQGVQTAVVVGSKSEEIYTDKHGRVKVQFHWDRQGKKDEKSSCWIRVSQTWAGQGWGAMHIPRVGQEVIVDFEEGDPDRPIVTGRVYHGTNVPPHSLPEHRTRSTIKSNSSPGGGGFNEIRLEDKKDQEELYTHAQRDRTEVVKRDRTTTVGENQKLTVGDDRTAEVERGDDTLDVSSGSRSVSVEQDASLDVSKGNRDVTVSMGDYSVNARAGSASVEAMQSVSVTGKMAGVEIKGGTKGVQVMGMGMGITLTGMGMGVTVTGMGMGVTISGTPTITMQAAMMTNLQTQKFIMLFEDTKFELDKSGLKVNEKSCISVDPTKKGPTSVKVNAP